MPDKVLSIPGLLDLVLAGAAGGLALVLMMRKLTPWGALTRIFVGILTAIYLTPIMVQGLARLGFVNDGTPDFRLAAGFLCGVTGMAVLSAAIEIVDRFHKRAAGGGGASGSMGGGTGGGSSGGGHG